MPVASLNVHVNEAKEIQSMKRLALGLMVVVLGASCAGQDVSSACVSSCMTEEPEHRTECETACVTFGDDAALATAEVKENCETGEPVPVPTGTLTWQCDGKARAAQTDSTYACDIQSLIYLGHGAYMSSYTTQQLACQRSINMALAAVNRRPGCGGYLAECFNCTLQ